MNYRQMERKKGTQGFSLNNDGFVFFMWFSRFVQNFREVAAKMEGEVVLWGPPPSQRGAKESTPQMRRIITLPKLLCYIKNMSTIWIISMIQKTFMRIWHTGPCILPVFSIPTASVRTQKVTIRILKRLTNVAYKHVIGGMAQFLYRHRMEASSGWSCGKH